jgi:hypothetical protein
VIQAAAIQYYFGREGQQFDLFYHPSPPSIPFITTRQKLDPPPSQNNNTQNNNRDQNRNTFVKFGREGIVPLYTMDPGYVPPESYERLMIGLSSFGLGSLALSKNWSKNMFMERGSSPWRVLIPMVGVVAVAVAATFLTSLAINSSIRAPQASEEEDKPNTKWNFVFVFLFLFISVKRQSRCALLLFWHVLFILIFFFRILLLGRLRRNK